MKPPVQSYQIGGHSGTQFLWASVSSSVGWNHPTPGNTNRLFVPVKKVRVLVAQLCPTLCNPADYPWKSSGKNTGKGCCSLLQGIFPTQGSNPGLLHCRQILFTVQATWEALTMCGGCEQHPLMACLHWRSVVLTSLCRNGFCPYRFAYSRHFTWI